MKPIFLLLFLFFILFISSCEPDTPYEEVYDEFTINSANSVIDKDTEWKDIHKGDTIDYYVQTMIRVRGNAVFTIKPGVNIAFETAESGIRVEENAALVANGEVANKIVFTSRNHANGVWTGLIFASDNPLNKLNYAQVLYAGGLRDIDYCDTTTAIGISGNKNANATITNTEVQYSASYGLWVANTKDINLTFSKNIFSDCDGPSVAISADNMAILDSFSDYNPYGSKHYIDVYGVSGVEIDGDKTIQKLNVPYRIANKVHVLNTLTISSGCVFEFKQGGEITTSDILKTAHNGIIKAEGKVGDSIEFRGIQPLQGSWVGITITSTGNNSFKYCKISDGGASTGFANTSLAKGNIIVGRSGHGANASVKYCRIFNSKTYGIHKFKDPINASNSSTVSTTIQLSIPPNNYNIETNKYSNNLIGNQGEYSD